MEHAISEYLTVAIVIFSPKQVASIVCVSDRESWDHMADWKGGKKEENKESKKRVASPNNAQFGYPMKIPPSCSDEG